MGSWEFRNLGVSTKNNNEALLKQLMECVGVDLRRGTYDSEVIQILPGFYYDIFGKFDGDESDSENFFI